MNLKKNLVFLGMMGAGKSSIGNLVSKELNLKFIDIDTLIEDVSGIRYTGRFDGDALGEMTITETTIVDGIGVQTFTNRFGDYSHLTMDPNNFSFWHTAEYFSSNNQWRIARKDLLH